MLDLLENSKDPRKPDRKEKEENRNLGLIGKGEQGNQFRCTVFEGIQGTEEAGNRIWRLGKEEKTG
jgi:hypothetical protein